MSNAGVHGLIDEEDVRESEIREPPGRRPPPAAKLYSIVQLFVRKHITRENEIRGCESLYPGIDR